MGPSQRQTGRLTVGRNLTSTSTSLRESPKTAVDKQEVGVRGSPDCEDVKHPLSGDVTEQRSEHEGRD
jgi:hypothetical protein